MDNAVSYSDTKNHICMYTSKQQTVYKECRRLLMQKGSKGSAGSKHHHLESPMLCEKIDTTSFPSSFFFCDFDAAGFVSSGGRHCSNPLGFSNVRLFSRPSLVFFNRLATLVGLTKDLPSCLCLLRAQVAMRQIKLISGLP